MTKANNEAKQVLERAEDTVGKMNEIAGLREIASLEPRKCVVDFGRDEQEDSASATLPDKEGNNAGWFSSLSCERIISGDVDERRKEDGHIGIPVVVNGRVERRMLREPHRQMARLVHH